MHHGWIAEKIRENGVREGLARIQSGEIKAQNYRAQNYRAQNDRHQDSQAQNYTRAAKNKKGAHKAPAPKRVEQLAQIPDE